MGTEVGVDQIAQVSWNFARDTIANIFFDFLCGFLYLTIPGFVASPKVNY
jgi:hypothetical protein